VLNAKPRLSSFSRLLLCQRVLAGRPVAHVAKEMGISRATAYKWLRRFREEGPTGLTDRSSRPHSCPHRLSEELEQQVLQCRRQRRVGPVRIAWELGLNPSTVGRVLRRHQVPRLSWCDPTTGVLLRGQRSSAERYEYDTAGGLVHIDVKKLGKIPDGGGWRLHGRSEKVRGRAQKHGKIGYDFVHSAVDDHSRLAYSEIHDDERAPTCAAFLARALAFFASHGAPVQRVITDNAFTYRHSTAWKQVLTDRGVKQMFIKPHCPWTNGKVERFNRTLQVEWAYNQPWTSNQHRRDALTGWLNHYNQTRPHTALNGHPPISRLSTT
jgi:transposase InsO family protein